MTTNLIELRKDHKKTSKKINPDEITKVFKETTPPIRSGKKNEKTSKKNKKTGENKDFGVKERNGFIKKTRYEEFLCMALYNRYSEKGIEIDKIGTQFFADYQTPIKEVKDDAGWGKVDLIGFSEKSVIFWEFKWNNSKETPIYALLEVLAYLKAFYKGEDKSKENLRKLILEINIKRKKEGKKEIKEKDITEQKVVIAAPAGYWGKNDNRRTLEENWEEIQKIQENLGITIFFCNFGKIDTESIVFDDETKGFRPKLNDALVKPEIITPSHENEH